MVVLGVVLMSLACAFLGYCGLQFHAELKRARARLTGYGLSRTSSSISANAIEIPARAIAMQMPQPIRRVERMSLNPEPAFLRATASVKVVSMYRKNRAVVSLPNTGVPVVKKAAKG
jgi:hypothetical protein